MKNLTFFSSKFFLLLFGITLVGQPVIAQYSKGKQLYDNNYFYQAIPLLKKSLDGKNSRAATESLAHSLRMIKNYPEAETYFARLVAFPDANPAHHFFYGEVLMNNGKYDEAEVQFEKYRVLAPSDPKATLMVNAVKELRKIKESSPGYSISAVKNLNSPDAEFSPALFGNGLVFATERPANLNYVTLPAQGLWKVRDLNLFYAPYAGTDSLTFGEPEDLHGKLNKGMLNGPVSFSRDGKTAVFTQVLPQPDKKMKVNYPKIFISHADGKGWTKPYELFEIEGYSNAHPSISPQGNVIFFSSNRPGGQGGYDIYTSTLSGTNWSEPVNVGALINTAMDEAFPVVDENGHLYFSSTGHPGLGGLDIFKAAKEQNGFKQPKNLLAPLNSSGDDFGMAFLPGGHKGYFSSNRMGGAGKDDIYSFATLNNTINITGKMLTGDGMNDPASNLKLVLVTDDGTVIQTTTTDNNGAFQFVNLPANEKYLVRLAEEDTGLNPYVKVFLSDDQGQVYKKTTTDNEGGFTFYNLPYTGNSLDGMIEDDTRITVTGSLLAGENPAKPLNEQTVYLTDEAGNVITTGTTDQYGNFKFEHLPPDGNYLVTIKPEDTQLSPNTRIVVTDSKGKTVRTFFTDGVGGFKFEVLAADNNTLRVLEEENTALHIDLKGKLLLDEVTKKPLANSTVQLVNEKGEVIRTGRTDAQGNFNFTNLPSDQVFLVSVAEQDVPVNVNELYVANDKGMVLRKLIFGKGGYRFEILKSDHSELASIYVEDPWLKIKDIQAAKKDSITVIENIYYEYGKYEVLPEAARTLDKVVKVLKENPGFFMELSSHTDSRSSAEFNLDLSRRRAKAAVDYIVSKGIPRNRITGVGMGESKLVNYCTEEVECSEEQHQQNRRTEFKITRRK